MYTVKFSILSYYPSFLSNENVNLGILFNISDDASSFCKFEYIKNNWRRVEAFDDEANIDFIKAVLKGISVDVEGLKCEEEFEFEKYKKYFVNEFKFSNTQIAEVDELSQFIDATKKIQLRFEFPKEQRPNEDDIKKYIKGFIQSAKLKYSLNKPTIGIYDENIIYDYLINDYAIKLFDLKEKHLSYLINNAKIWAYNANEIKGDYKSVFIYDEEDSDLVKDEGYAKNLKTIMKILSESAYKVLPLEEGVEFIAHLRQ